MKHFSDEEFAAYVAAFMDGEGSIVLSKHGHYFFVRCVLTNTHKNVIFAMRRRLSFGNIYTSRQKTEYKTMYRLFIDGFENNETFLKMIQPYLIIKAAKARKALAIVKIRKEAVEFQQHRNKLILAEVNKGIPQTTIAKRFGVCQQSVSLIKNSHKRAKKRKYYRVLKRQRLSRRNI